MLKLPQFSLKSFEVDSLDPFIQNALRKRGVNEICWCGLNKKYKKCHLSKHSQEPYSLGRITHEKDQIFWRRRGCTHIDVENNSCEGVVIDSHTIQKRGILKFIVDKTNHVLKFSSQNDNEKLEATKISWNKASTFPGFCSKHDAEIFRNLETVEFIGSPEQCVLQSYRAICNEYYKKLALIETFEFFKSVLDKGKTIQDQISIQYSILKSIKSQSKSLEELNNLRKFFREIISTKNFDLVSSAIYFFEGDISVISTSTVHAEFCFEGRKLIDMWNLKLDAQGLTHAVLNTLKGGAVMFCWPRNFKDATKVFDSFNKIDDDDKSDIFIQYCFLNSENTYFSEKWWDALSIQHKDYVTQLANMTYYEGGQFVPCRPRLLNWKIIDKIYNNI